MSIDYQSVRSSVSLVDTVARYLDIRAAGREFRALCPFHDEKSPSFTVHEGSDRIWRYHCFGCGCGGDVIDFIEAIEGCDTAAAVEKLSGDTLPAVGTYVLPKLTPDQSKCWEPIIPPPADAPEYNPEFTYNPKKDAIKNYKSIMERLDAYRDEAGNLLFYVIRLRLTKDVKITPVITYCAGPGGKFMWASKRGDPPYPVLNLDQLEMRPDATVVLVSGEKCGGLLALDQPEMIVVTWLGGDDAVDSTDWRPLRGRKIAYWADRDDSGYKAIRKIWNIVED